MKIWDGFEQIQQNDTIVLRLSAIIYSRKILRGLTLPHGISQNTITYRQIFPSISAMLNFLYSNRIRETRFGFYIMGTQAFKKSDYPHHYIIQLIDGAKGLL